MHNGLHERVRGIGLEDGRPLEVQRLGGLEERPFGGAERALVHRPPMEIDLGVARSPALPGVPEAAHVAFRPLAAPPVSSHDA